MLWLQLFCYRPTTKLFLCDHYPWCIGPHHTGNQPPPSPTCNIVLLPCKLEQSTRSTATSTQESGRRLTCERASVIMASDAQNAMTSYILNGSKRSFSSLVKRQQNNFAILWSMHCNVFLVCTQCQSRNRFNDTILLYVQLFILF